LREKYIDKTCKRLAEPETSREISTNSNSDEKWVGMKMLNIQKVA
jgi:hypothetical protein